jgi:hypothetical protein
MRRVAVEDNIAERRPTASETRSAGRGEQLEQFAATWASPPTGGIEDGRHGDGIAPIAQRTDLAALPALTRPRTPRRSAALAPPGQRASPPLIGTTPRARPRRELASWPARRSHPRAKRLPEPTLATDDRTLGVAIIGPLGRGRAHFELPVDRSGPGWPSGPGWLEHKLGSTGSDGRRLMEVTRADERESGDCAEEHDDASDGEELVGA